MQFGRTCVFVNFFVANIKCEKVS